MIIKVSIHCLLHRLSLTVGVVEKGDPRDVICQSNIDAIYSCLFEAMRDYTLDSRGDVGAW